MKVKIRKTGEIVNIAEYAKITLDICDSNGNPIELNPEEVELIQDVKEENSQSPDWEQRRYEIAKEILATSHIAQQIGGYSYVEGDEVKDAVGMADLLIKELKKEKQQ